MLNLAPTSTDNPFRRRRVETLNAMIADVKSRQPVCKVIDFGGTRNFWHTWRDHIQLDGVQVDCVNMDEHHASDSGYDKINFIKGDARDLGQVDDKSYDIAFSNSVIEHVGGWSDMLRMANEVRRVAHHYAVQTPYFWFPIEPHMRSPLMHWLPESISYRIVMSRKCGFYDKQDTVLGAMSVVRDAHLLDVGQMQALFPDATISKERFLGLVKSLTAIRH